MLSSALTLLAVAAIASGAPTDLYCSKPPYKAVLALSNYQPAQAFCAAKFPIAPATVTVTVPAAAARMAVRSPVTPAPLVKDAVTPCTGNCAVLSSLAKVGGSIIKSACGCIQTQSTVTATVTASPPPPAFCRNQKSTRNRLPNCEQINGNNIFGPGSETHWSQGPEAYAGADLTPDPNSPAYRPTGGQNFCGLAANCASYYTVNSPSTTIFSLVFDPSRQGWWCQAALSTSFDVKNCNIEQAFAFSKTS